VSGMAGGKTVIDPSGRPYFSLEIAPRDYVEVHMTTSVNELPFKIVFKSFDSIGGILEEREYAQAGTKELAQKFAIETANLRLNSREFVLDGE